MASLVPAALQQRGVRQPDCYLLVGGIAIKMKRGGYGGSACFQKKQRFGRNPWGARSLIGHNNESRNPV